MESSDSDGLTVLPNERVLARRRFERKRSLERWRYAWMPLGNAVLFNNFRHQYAAVVSGCEFDEDFEI